MTVKETPLNIVQKWLKMAPDCYRMLDYLAAAKTDGEDWWADYCPLPIAASMTFLLEREQVEPRAAAVVASELLACWAWRKHKVIYAFDPDLARTLADQAEKLDETDVLPCDLLLHLPYPCVYIQVPGLWPSTSDPLPGTSPRASRSLLPKQKRPV